MAALYQQRLGVLSLDYPYLGLAQGEAERQAPPPVLALQGVPCRLFALAPLSLLDTAWVR